MTLGANQFGEQSEKSGQTSAKQAVISSCCVLMWAWFDQ